MHCPRVKTSIHAAECPGIILATQDRRLFALCHACPQGRRLVAAVRWQRDEEPEADSVQPSQHACAEYFDRMRAVEAAHRLDVPSAPKEAPMQDLNVASPMPSASIKTARRKSPAPASKTVRSAATPDLATVPLEQLVAEVRRRAPKSVFIPFL